MKVKIIGINHNQVKLPPIELDHRIKIKKRLISKVDNNKKLDYYT